MWFFLSVQRFVLRTPITARDWNLVCCVMATEWFTQGWKWLIAYWRLGSRHSNCCLICGEQYSSEAFFLGFHTVNIYFSSIRAVTHAIKTLFNNHRKCHSETEWHHNRTHSTNFILSQVNQSHITQTYFRNVHFSIILILPSKIVYEFIVSVMWALILYTLSKLRGYIVITDTFYSENLKARDRLGDSRLDGKTMLTLNLEN